MKPHLRWLAALLAFGASFGAHALDVAVGRVHVSLGQAGWRQVADLPASTVALEGSFAELPSASRLLAFESDGVTDVVLALRASQAGVPVRVNWTPACESTATIEARRLSEDFDLPDCLKLSKPLKARTFVDRGGMPALKGVVESKELALPDRARYFSFIVAQKNGTFVSGAGLVSERVPDASRWVARLAEAARDSTLSLTGALSMPPVPVPTLPEK